MKTVRDEAREIQEKIASLEHQEMLAATLEMSVITEELRVFAATGQKPDNPASDAIRKQQRWLRFQIDYLYETHPCLELAELIGDEAYREYASRYPVGGRFHIKRIPDSWRGITWSYHTPCLTGEDATTLPSQDAIRQVALERVTTPNGIYDLAYAPEVRLIYYLMVAGGPR